MMVVTEQQREEGRQRDSDEAQDGLKGPAPSKLQLTQAEVTDEEEGEEIVDEILHSQGQ